MLNESEAEFFTQLARICLFRMVHGFTTTVNLPILFRLKL